MKKSLVAIVLSLSMTACGSFKPTDDHVYTASVATCTMISNSLDLASANIDKLSNKQVEIMLEAGKAVQPICGSSTKPNLNSAKQAVLNEAFNRLVGAGLAVPNQPAQ